MIPLSTQKGFEQEARRKDRSVGTIADRSSKLARIHREQNCDDFVEARRGEAWRVAVRTYANAYFSRRREGRHLEAIAMHKALAAMDKAMQQAITAGPGIARILFELSGRPAADIDDHFQAILGKHLDELEDGISFTTLPNIGVQP